MDVTHFSTKASFNTGKPPPQGPQPRFNRSRFRSSPESEARLLLLIDAFSRSSSGRERYLEGRVKLAKLDFLLRYPHHLRRLLTLLDIAVDLTADINSSEAPFESRMMRYRYGPWDPSYYAVLGSLIGRGLVSVKALPGKSGFGYRTTEIGNTLATSIRSDESFMYISNRIKILRQHFDKSGNTLRKHLYEIPEIRDAQWHEEILWTNLLANLTLLNAIGWRFPKLN